MDTSYEKAGMTEEDFIEYLGDNNISIFYFDDKEVLLFLKIVRK